MNYEWLVAMSHIKYRDWRYIIFDNANDPYLQIQFEENGETQYCRRWFLSEKMSVSDVVRTAFMATLAAEEHEARERFTYRGKRIFGPHYDVDRLVEIAVRENLAINAVEPHA